MKFITSIFLCAVALGISSCLGNDNATRSGNHEEVTTGTNREVEAVLETIRYTWGDYGVDVSFSKRDNESKWGMTVEDAGNIYEQSKEGKKVWGLSTSKCSSKQCIHLIEQSLERFRTEKPDARLEYVAVEMQVVREIWGDLLVRIQQKLSVMKGKKSDQPGDIPPEIYQELQIVLNKSAAVTKIRSVLNAQGVNTHTIGIASQILFRTSLNGRSWTDIASSPGLGIEVPGVFEFLSEDTKQH